MSGNPHPCGPSARSLRAALGRAFTAAGLAAWAVAAACARAPGEPAPGEDAPRPGVTRVHIDRMLDVGTLALLQRGIREARSSGHDCLLIEIDTPGGEVELMNRYVRMVQDAGGGGLLTVAWVNGGATSAGALVALACEKVYMTSSSTIGAATPVSFGPQGVTPIGEEGGLGAKVISYVSSRFRAVADAGGRPTALAEAMVDPDVEVREVRVEGERRFYTGKEWDAAIQRMETPELLSIVVRRGEVLSLIGGEAYKLGLTDGTAESLDEVLARVGKRGIQPASLERSRSEEVLSFLQRISPLLLMAGLILGYMELRAPGFGIPGILSLACFLVLLIGKYLAGLADVPHLVLVFVGLALLATELFLIPGTIWIGALGGVMVLLGLFTAELGPGFDLSSEFGIARALSSAFQLATTAAVALVGVWLVSRYLPAVPVLGRMVQVPATEGGSFAEAMPESRSRGAALARPGARGRALTALRPVGKVALDEDPGVEFEARAEGELIDPGRAVTVLAVVGGRLVVEAAAESSAGPAGKERA